MKINFIRIACSVILCLSVRVALAQDNLGNHIATQDILPATDNALKLGTPAKRFKDVHMSGALYWGDPGILGITNRVFTSNIPGEFLSVREQV